MSNPPAQPARDPKALTPEYHKARKQLMLWAGILFIWELVGIDLDKAKDSGGNAGAIITAIKSPQAVPWVLVILVGYFSFKLWVEWQQCEPRRRIVKAARIDLGSAWAVASVAVTLYAYQAISHIQLADLLQSSKRAQSVLFGLSLILPISSVAVAISPLNRAGKLRAEVICLMVLFSTLLSCLTFELAEGTTSIGYTAFGLFIGLTITALIIFMYRNLRSRRLASGLLRKENFPAK